MTTLFCPYCWLEIESGVVICPQCQASLTEDHRNYVDKLIAALRHPEGFTQRRAAYVLGLIGDPRAVEALIAVLQHGEADPYVRAQVTETLGLIGTSKARSVLEQVANDANQSVLVRHKAATALEGYVTAARD